MDITESELIWILGLALLLPLLLGLPAFRSGVRLLRGERALGRLYWHVRINLDRRSKP
jgi:hypothetical protein